MSDAIEKSRVRLQELLEIATELRKPSTSGVASPGPTSRPDGQGQVGAVTAPDDGRRPTWLTRPMTQATALGL
jgi:hypothetical protein